jgi:SAM-dependent methyltransferase
MIVVQCGDCGLVMTDPQPDDATLERIYDETYFIGSGRDDLEIETGLLKRGTARLQLAEIIAYVEDGGNSHIRPRVLEVGCGLGDFLVEARAAGFDIQGVDFSASAVAVANRTLGEEIARSGRLEDLNIPDGSLDIVVLADLIEHVRDPAQLIDQVRRMVKPGGVVFVATPSLDSLSARLMGRFWVEFKLEHLFYFDPRTIARLLGRAGFENIAVSPGRKMLSAAYIIAHFERFPVPLLTPGLKILKSLLPAWARNRPLRLTASGINVIATAATAGDAEGRRS